MEKIMIKTEILEILHNYKKEFAAQYGILQIGIFGSVARDEVGEDSDVDVVVRISKPDLFMLAGIKNELEGEVSANSGHCFVQRKYESILKKKDRCGVCICMTKNLP